MAIDDLLDEHEQGVRVQNWLRKNGPGLILGLAVGLGLLAAWSWYRGHQAANGMADAERYATALKAIDTNPKAVEASIRAIEGESYRTLANLALAKAQVTAGDSAKAMVTLQSIKSDNASINELVAVRLGRLQIETGKAADAVAQLNGKSTPEALEVLGDAYYATQRLDAARKAYQQALGKLDSASAQRPIVELKLTEAGGTPAAQPEAKS